MGAIYTIPSQLPFLDTLVSGLKPRGKDPLALARMTILLPTRRAARALGEAFLRAGGGKALLLPKLVPVGDLDAEELALLADEGEIGEGLDIPPAVPDLRRKLLLARLVLAWGRAQGNPLLPSQAAPLAAELARFLDEVQAEKCSFDALAGLAPEDHAEHWQRVLAFLDIVTEQWPAMLAEIGCLDPGARRNLVLEAQIEAWRRSPPQTPVIVAGVTGGVPAVAELVAAAAQLPEGIVVLPGLDQSADADTWSEILLDPGHPQHLMARLLRRLEIEPAAVPLWPAAKKPRGAAASRMQLIAETMRPAASCERWRGLARMNKDALDGLKRLDCPGPQEEALVIALLLRQKLQTDGAVAALVTPDRGLARRVAAELRRWGIDIDDSAGVPLHRTPPGVFLRLVAEALAEKLAPLPLLSLLKHPLAACGYAPEGLRLLVRRLEIVALRGPRPAGGIAGLRSALAESKLAVAERLPLLDLLAALDHAIAPLAAALVAPETTLAALVTAHISAAEALALSVTESGAARLWREPAGEAAAQVLAEMVAAADTFPMLAGGDYPALFEALLAGTVVRPAYGRHPRLFIWGLLEARLQQADRLVLGGLNEGVWPAQVESDPWLSRPMRRSFGMPEPERRIGVAAHDFVQALGAREVFLTRAERVEGTPTVPSRWLLRLDTVLESVGLKDRVKDAWEPLAWQAAMDEPAGAPTPIAAPEPRPPVAARPRRLSVTQIGTWMRDPYAIYARYILRLTALEPLDADPGFAERGIFIHKALDDFLRHCPDRLPEDALAQLLMFGRAAFGPALERPGVRAFWWPRFERIARWFIEAETERRATLTVIRTECGGTLALPAAAGTFTLTAKADRIDRRADGSFAIIDYKTGGVPKNGEVDLGFAPQLPLEAAIAEAGGFAALGAGEVRELAFWRLTGADPAGEITILGDSAAALRRLIDNAVAGLAGLVARFDDPATPYRAEPRPERAPRYSDYRHLARIAEWSVTGEAEE